MGPLLRKKKQVSGNFSFSGRDVGSVEVFLSKPGFYDARAYVDVMGNKPLKIKMVWSGQVVSLSRLCCSIDYDEKYVRVMDFSVPLSFTKQMSASDLKSLKNIPESGMYIRLDQWPEDLGKRYGRKETKPSCYLKMSNPADGFVVFDTDVKNEFEVIKLMREAPASGYAPEIELHDRGKVYFYCLVDGRYGKGYFHANHESVSGSVIIFLQAEDGVGFNVAGEYVP